MNAEIFSENHISFISKELRDQHFNNDRTTVSHLNFLVDYLVPNFILYTFMIEYNLSENDALSQIEKQTQKINLMNPETMSDDEGEGLDHLNDDSFFY